MAADINQVYRERNTLAIAFVLLAAKAGLKAGVTMPKGKTCLMVQVDENTQISYFCFGAEAEIAQRVLPQVDLAWDGTYLGTTSDWIDALAKAIGMVPEPEVEPDLFSD
jgi:hypothetical protein